MGTQTKLIHILILCRIESALLMMKPHDLECIKDFPLNNEKIVIKIPYNEHGKFITEPSMPPASTQPYINTVYPFIVRTELANFMTQQWLKEARSATIKEADEEGRDVYLQTDFDQHINPDEEEASENIFTYTKLDNRFVYEYFSEDTIRRANVPDSVRRNGVFPDMFHSVMVTSNFLSKMYSEPVLQAILRQAYSASSKTKASYNERFGNFENAVQNAPFLQNEPKRLPQGVHTGKGGGIPVTLLSNVLSSKLASVAAFFSFACYDERSINGAYALLQKDMNCGDIIKHQETLFPQGLVFLCENKNENYLFIETVMDDGKLFVTNVVNMVNRLADCMNSYASTSPAKSDVSVTLQRLQSHLFRTMCSDMVEIYVSHGCYPLCEKSTLGYHPVLGAMAKRHAKMQPVPLLLEYIIHLIAEKKLLFAQAITSKGPHHTSYARTKHKGKRERQVKILPDQLQLTFGTCTNVLVCHKRKRCG
jgi:hypothetical protein